MQFRYIFFLIITLAIILFTTNPFENKRNQVNYYLFSTRIKYKYSVLKSTELGILSRWIEIPEIPIMPILVPNCKGRCKNGVCLSSTCYCPSGFTGKTCTWKRPWFRSLFDEYFYFTTRIWNIIPNHYSLKAYLDVYSLSECILGIPIEYLPSNLLFLRHTLLHNLTTKLCLLDLILIGLIFAFLHTKLVQTGFIRDNYWYVRYPVLYLFYNPYLIPFGFNILMFYDCALKLLNEIQSLFYIYLVTLVLLSTIYQNYGSKSFGLLSLILSMEILIGLIEGVGIGLAKELATKYGVVLLMTGLDLGMVALGALVSFLVYCLH